MRVAPVDASQCLVRQTPLFFGHSRHEVRMPIPREQCPSGQTQRAVCIVDDDEWVADSLKILLEAFGFAVQSYNSGNGFLADERRCTAGCLVIDQHMPGMSGLDVVEHLQKEGNQVTTILISGRLDPKTRERATRLGVRQLLDKPFAADRLIELVQGILLETD
jgi:two-component system, LuxR family, response regulator FixJ